MRARLIRPRGAVVAVAAIVAALTGRVDLAAAQVVISGTGDNLEVKIHGATIGEVLSALHDRLGVAYRSKVSLDETVGGQYSGALVKILGRVLSGYDYVIGRSGSGTLSVSVITKSGAAAAIVATAAALPSQPFVRSARER